tara:strand:+ start:10922 stop:11863 length:942 start_codon:yes stop_codon:yes gene_type:complete
MKVLITGASGYLGGRFTDFFSKKYDLRLASRKEILNIDSSGQFTIEQSLINWEDLESINNSLVNIDTVIHLAGLNAEESFKNPTKAIEINKNNTQKILALSVKNNVENFIYLSTAHVYANPLQGIISEDSPIEGDHPYATSHFMGENILYDMHSKGLINGKILRLSNAYGPPVNKSANCWMLIINDLCKQLVINKRMKLKTNGNQRRNFISISDTSKAIEHLIHIKPQANPVFNIGSKWNPKIKEVVDYLADRFEIIGNYRPDIIFNDDDTQESLQLDYRIDKLLESGFSFDNPDSKEAEIDKLIKKCIEFYD